ncbi:hypothetical protein ACTVZO_42895 [Streptomyces sp. IBSNAI002]|uniref:hypothetical protein n=1 Tax=Streptomyces sp. IBSNAI002 TaxID=3457500 RepID=UPI003FCF50B1
MRIRLALGSAATAAVVLTTGVAVASAAPTPGSWTISIGDGTLKHDGTSPLHVVIDVPVEVNCPKEAGTQKIDLRLSQGTGHENPLARLSLDVPCTGSPEHKVAKFSVNPAPAKPFKEGTALVNWYFISPGLAGHQDITLSR